MNKFKFSIVVISALVIALMLISWNDSYLFKINKSFEIFGSIFKYISNNYVEEIDPEELVEDGIKGLLENLDPYTDYYNESEADDIDVLTTGQYTGLGISVAVRDSMLTITSVRDGYSAQREGIRIGDRIYRINDAVLLNSNSKELRKYTRGEPGTQCEMCVLRSGTKDTICFILTRELIAVNNVTYSGFIENNIGYIRLERFSKNAANEVRQAISELKAGDSLNALILDLRNNPGGLLESAISVSSLFLPSGTVVVSTKGRNRSSNEVYRSNAKPILPTTPVSILINENSASASEIVAGAIQDHDRGIVIGRRSYGKGLVQSVYQVPYNGNLKITTAKYYTPSGRCIQKLDLLKRKDNLNFLPNDSSIFYTGNGRKVYEFVGILPDTVVPAEIIPNYVKELSLNGIAFNFMNDYLGANNSFKLRTDKVPDEIMKGFNKYITDTKFQYNSELKKQIEQMKLAAMADNYSAKTSKQIEKLEQSINEESKELFKLNEKSIEKLLYFELISRLFNERDFIRESIKRDDDVKTASKILLSKSYESILAGRNDSWDN